MKRTIVEAAFTGVFFVSTTVAALAAVTPAQKCEGAKNDAAGKYASCLAKAEKGFVTSGDGVKYAAALGKCEDKYTGSWVKAEAPGACTTTLDQTGIQDFVGACSQGVAGALDGDPLPTFCDDEMTTCPEDLIACNADLDTCETDLGTCNALPPARLLKTGQTTCFLGNLADTTSCGGTGQDGEIQAGVAQVFVDNLDGTITDQSTGLMWERLSNDGSVHDKDTQYYWGNAYAVKIAQLNSGSFAGYTDWRLPNVTELLSLIDYNNSSPAVNTTMFNTACPVSCTPTTCSCTSLSYYWTSTTYANEKSDAWAISGDDGDVQRSDKDAATQYVRAVRGGL